MYVHFIYIIHIVAMCTATKEKQLFISDVNTQYEWTCTFVSLYHAYGEHLKSTGNIVTVKTESV